MANMSRRAPTLSLPARTSSPSSSESFLSHTMNVERNMELSRHSYFSSYITNSTHSHLIMDHFVHGIDISSCYTKENCCQCLSWIILMISTFWASLFCRALALIYGCHGKHEGEINGSHVKLPTMLVMSNLIYLQPFNLKPINFYLCST